MYVYGGVAVACGLAGLGLAAWQRTQPAAADPADPIWGLSFDTPTGSSLSMQTLRGRPVLVNFWATWCPPCVDELPLLESFYKQNAAKGWQVLGLAVDQPSAVRAFLARAGVSFLVGMAGLDGTDLSIRLGNTGGALPFSVVFGRGGAVLARKLGRVSSEELTQWVSMA